MRKEGNFVLNLLISLLYFFPQLVSILGGMFTALGMNNLDYSEPENKICFLVPERQFLCRN